MKLQNSFLAFLLLFLASPLAFSQESVPPTAPAASAVEPPYSNFFKTTFLDLSTIYHDLSIAAIEELLPPPVEGTAELQDDQALRKNVFDEATKKEIYMAKESEDSIFSYAYTLGNSFSPHYLPKTKALFDKVDDDVRLAIYVAKRFYGRRRPMSASGYSYPSGHSTRAFLWDTLLAEIFPDAKDLLENQAEMKGWNRVILGRHYPADVYAGKAFGIYLAQRLLENPVFQKEWQAAREEIKACVGSNVSIANTHALSSRVP